MKNITKRVTPMLLAICLVLTMSVPAFAASFTDVPPTHWSYTAVERAVANALVSGVGGGLYLPDKSVSNAEWCKMLANLFEPELPGAEAGQPWWLPSVKYANTQGFLEGTTLASAGLENEYVVNASISRYDMAQTIYKIATGSKLNVSVDTAGIRAYIADYNNIPGDYINAVEFCYASGFIMGVDGVGTFAGNDYMTRGAAATVLCRLLDAKNGGWAIPDRTDTTVPETTQPEPTPPEPVAPEPPSPPAPSVAGIAVGESLSMVENERTAYRTIAAGGGQWKFYNAYDGFVMVYYLSDNTVQCVYTTAVTSGEGTQYTDKNDGSRVYAMSVGTFPKDSNDTAAQLMFEITNAFRASNSLAPLKWNNTLAQVAVAHCLDMAARKYFDHTNPDGDTPGNRLTAAGYTWCAYGENINMGYSNAVSAMDGWINSAGHRGNILTTDCDEIGIGWTAVEGEYSYGTQVFGKRM